jgi:hypothetical protein
MSIRFEDTGPPAGGEELTELETRAGHALPVAYRDFLEAHDGATPEPNHLPDAVADHDVAVRSFYAVEDVLRQLETLAERIPEELLPISDDEYGSGLFLHLEDGSVWSWDPDAEDVAEEDLWAAFTREAEDLDELLDRLEPEASDFDAEPEPLDEGYLDAEAFREGREADSEE